MSKSFARGGLNPRLPGTADISKHITYPSMLKASPLPDKRLSSSTGTADTMLETQQKDCNPNASSAHPAVLAWSMQDVCAFVRSIDLCAEYADMFLDERIDGWCLSLLTESHLTGNLGMKLGPALKLRSMLASVSSMPCDGRTVLKADKLM
ncbi:hypothetical protein HAZT_HAZT009130 [Hyalella azteca]|uniref:SAM domain-containing protein n=1 Tax=Hyalella azteca TaxID=294128 RepID=A0A6A0HB44_HYAAZ|nr:hypothetical protein HAZT_HAZT009130 [Hyalella azteca]